MRSCGSPKVEGLNRSTADEQALDGHLQDVDVVEHEVLQSREKKHMRSFNLGVGGGGASPKTSEAQCVREAEHGQQQ